MNDNFLDRLAGRALQSAGESTELPKGTTEHEADAKFTRDALVCGMAAGECRLETIFLVNELKAAGENAITGGKKLVAKSIALVKKYTNAVISLFKSFGNKLGFKTEHLKKRKNEIKDLKKDLEKSSKQIDSETTMDIKQYDWKAIIGLITSPSEGDGGPNIPSFSGTVTLQNMYAVGSYFGSLATTAGVKGAPSGISSQGDLEKLEDALKKFAQDNEVKELVEKDIDELVKDIDEKEFTGNAIRTEVLRQLNGLLATGDIFKDQKIKKKTDKAIKDLGKLVKELNKIQGDANVADGVAEAAATLATISGHTSTLLSQFQSGYFVTIAAVQTALDHLVIYGNKVKGMEK